MSDRSAISWTDASWNPVSGCTEVSPGCANCYAKTFAERFRGVPGHYYENGFDLTIRENKLEEPLHWRRPRRIFVNSMSDLFHEALPASYIARCFAVMAQAPQHTFQILTKRIEIALSMLVGERDFYWRVEHGGPDGQRITLPAWPLPNVIIGPTIENQVQCVRRGQFVRGLHSAGWKTMVSYEPALGPVDFTPYLIGIDWLICGGESGVKRRPFDVEWARSALAQCRAAGVPFWFKQMGDATPENLAGAPEDVVVREFPA